MKGPHTFTESSSYALKADVKIGSSDENIFVAAERIGIIGQHPNILRAIEDAGDYAWSRKPVLILGETGTGKELFARLIHQLSGRKTFVVCNCATLTEELAESKLFGHKKGSFTGAIYDRMGVFEQANGGTLFLDELAEIPVSVQTMLLRVLEDQTVTPLGATAGHKVDVRILAATNQDLSELIKAGRFRRELYYRLDVGRVSLPTLCERRNDIRTIAMQVLKRSVTETGIVKSLTNEALTALQNHSWPGNVRELENTLWRSICRSRRKETIEVDDLEIEKTDEEKDLYWYLPEPYEGFRLKKFVEDIHKEMYRRATKRAKNNLREAAKLLGVSPQAVHKQMKRINVS